MVYRVVLTAWMVVGLSPEPPPMLVDTPEVNQGVGVQRSRMQEKMMILLQAQIF